MNLRINLSISAKKAAVIFIGVGKTCYCDNILIVTIFLLWRLVNTSIIFKLIFKFHAVFNCKPQSCFSLKLNQVYWSSYKRMGRNNSEMGELKEYYLTMYQNNWFDILIKRWTTLIKNLKTSKLVPVFNVRLKCYFNSYRKEWLIVKHYCHKLLSIII